MRGAHAASTTTADTKVVAPGRGEELGVRPRAGERGVALVGIVQHERHEPADQLDAVTLEHGAERVRLARQEARVRRARRRWMPSDVISPRTRSASSITPQPGTSQTPQEMGPAPMRSPTADRSERSLARWSAPGEIH